MRLSPRRVAAVLGLVFAALLGFAYARPVSVFEAWGALRLRISGVRSAHVQAGPYRLHYLEAGAGPPLLLVHGLGSSATQDWSRLIPALGRRFHVFAPDLPGFGESERPAGADYSIPMQVEAVRAFLHAVGVSRARVAGLSMGGWIVSRLAGEHPESVERLVVVDAAGMRPDGLRIPAEALLPRDEEGVRRLVATVRNNAPVPPSFVARDILARRLREEWIVRRALESMGAGRDWLNGTLGRADMPVLVVWGKQDRLIPVDHAFALEAEFPRAELAVLDGCGHVPMADCPEAFDRVFVPFLAAGETPGPAAPARPARDTLYVSAPFVALADGVFDGEVTFAELKRHGDLGLGAITGSDGELVLLDGRCHQVKGDGSVVALPDSGTTPWAIATFFEPEWEMELAEPVDLPALRLLLDAKLGHPGLPYALRIEGRFPQIRTRSVAGQKPPYRRLIEVIKDQVTFDLENVSGTIVGFRVPGYLEGVNVPGYHMHFLTADRRAGGHVLAFRAERLRVAADASTAVHVELPRDPRFSTKESRPVDRGEMDRILGRVPLREAPRPR